MRKNKGITLIALVITIIVLLILAGVALRMVAGNEGILSKAETAVNKTDIAGAKEQTEIMLAELSADYYEKKFVDKTESGNLVNYIKNALATAKPTSNGEFSVSIDGNGNVSVTDKGVNSVVEGTLDENGKIIWGENAGGNGGSGGAVVEPPLEVPENPVASYDISAAEDGSVMAYVLQREGETERYDLLIIGQGEMMELLNSYEEPIYNEYVIVTAEISPGVTNIGRQMFYNCRDLRSVKIPGSVESIGNFAFEYCSALSDISITEGLTSIGWSAFSGCTSLSSINIPESVTSIENSAFYRCTNLSSINIPESVTSIEKDAFYGTAWYNSQPDGVVYAGKVLYNYKGTMPSNTTITVNEGTKDIADDAFYDCTSLSSINIPDSVTSIGDSAFYRCTSLSSINIPESVTSIGGSAFYGCKSLSSINIPDSVTSIEEAAFEDCTSLSSINIPDSVTSIEGNAFYGCTNLSSITIDSATIASGLTSQTAQGYLINYATTIYVKSGLTVGSYVTTNYTETTSDKSGYVKYTK